MRDLHTHRALLAHVFTPITLNFLLRVSLGIGGPSPAEPPPESDALRKGISAERTFAAISTQQDLEAKLVEITGRVAEGMAKEGLAGKCVTLKLKESTFKVRRQTPPKIG